MESPDSKSAKIKAKKLADSADELVLNPNYRDLVKNMERVLTVHSRFDERTKECMVRWLKEMNFGMQKFLKQEVYSFEDLNEYCYYVAGTPSGVLTESLLGSAGLGQLCGCYQRVACTRVVVGSACR